MEVKGVTGMLSVIDYEELLDSSLDLSSKVEAGFGVGGLGIVAVRNVPGYVEAREELLPLAERIEKLPESVKESLEDPESNFSFGWSFGKESLRNGSRDFLKGSYYANPITDLPTSDPDLQQRYPSYCRPNVWPSIQLPELQPAFKRLGKIMVDTGLLLAEHCDRYAQERSRGMGKTAERGFLLEPLKRSFSHKARLLLYMPSHTTSMSTQSKNETEPSDEKTNPLWCGWHLDHGALTGLTSPQYRKDSEEVPCPDTRSGLFIQKNGEDIKVGIPQDCIAFQMGQAMSILSGGLLCATRHCVQAAQGPLAAGTTRSTFAVFMQPNWEEPLNNLLGLTPSESTRATWGPWKPGMTFGKFSEEVIRSYY